MAKFSGSNKVYSNYMKENYCDWKKKSLANTGYFIIFKGFKDTNKLEKISGNALKLYVYLGLNSNNSTGEVWHSNAKIAKYFCRSERTIRFWMQELESLNLIRRIQLKFNEESHTFLQPYSNYNIINDSEKYIYTYRLKNLKARDNTNLKKYEESLNDVIKSTISNVKVYIVVKEKTFDITSYSPIESKYLRMMSKAILEKLPVFNDFVKEYKIKNQDGIEVIKRQLFERVKIKRRAIKL